MKTTRENREFKAQKSAYELMTCTNLYFDRMPGHRFVIDKSLGEMLKYLDDDFSDWLEWVPDSGYTRYDIETGTDVEYHQYTYLDVLLSLAEKYNVYGYMPISGYLSVSLDELHRNVLNRLDVIEYI